MIGCFKTITYSNYRTGTYFNITHGSATTAYLAYSEQTVGYIKTIGNVEGAKIEINVLVIPQGRFIEGAI